MLFDISSAPSYSALTITFKVGEVAFINSGTFYSCSAGLKITASTPGGVTGAYLRKKFTKETFFMTKLEAELDAAWVSAAPHFPGDLKTLLVGPNETLFLEAGNLLGYCGDLKLDVRMPGLVNIALHEGAAVMRIINKSSTEKAVLFIAGFGGLETKELSVGEKIIVDSGHLVAWTAGCSMKAGPFTSVLRSNLLKEGIVAEIVGPGRALLQTRSPEHLSDWLLGNEGPQKA